MIVIKLLFYDNISIYIVIIYPQSSHFRKKILEKKIETHNNMQNCMKLSEKYTLSQQLLQYRVFNMERPETYLYCQIARME